MCVSMVEVYNETVRDLLSESSGSQQLNIQMRNKQLVITDVTEIDVKSAADIKSIMEKGKKLYSQGRLTWGACLRFLPSSLTMLFSNSFHQMSRPTLGGKK